MDLLLRNDKGGEQLTSQIEKAIESSPPRIPSRNMPVQPWKPFPVSDLPEPFSSFVLSTARARQCDPAAVALPLLSCLAGVIGNARTVRIWADWYAPAILWTALICRSGAVKSPAFRASREPLDRMERKERARYDEERQRFEVEKVQHEARAQDWKRLPFLKRGEPPLKPEAPVMRRFVMEDVTLQALARVLVDAPRGVTLARDELSGWIRSFDQFTGATGADVARWLEIYRAGSLSVDRVGSGYLFVPRAAVSICGTIQDEVVVNVFSGEHQANGMLSRFLLANPPEPKRQWCSSRTASDVTDIVADRFAALDCLDLPADDELPRALGLSGDAEALYGPWFNTLNERRRDTEPGPFRSAIAKAEELPGRLGLILSLGRSENPASVDSIDGDTMPRAIALANWFINEVERVLSVFTETDDQRDARTLVEWVRDRGEVTARDVARGIRRYSGRGGSERAEVDLKHRVAAGDLVATERPCGPQGGRPTTGYRTPHPVDTAETPFSPGKSEVVSTSTGSTPSEKPLPDPPLGVDLPVTESADHDLDEPDSTPTSDLFDQDEPYGKEDMSIRIWAFLSSNGPQKPEILGPALGLKSGFVVRYLERLEADGRAERLDDGSWAAAGTFTPGEEGKHKEETEAGGAEPEDEEAVEWRG